MNLTSDQQIFWQHGIIKLNGTIVTTWVMMLLMSLGAKLITRRLATEGPISRWQGGLEIVVTGHQKQIRDVGSRPAREISHPFWARSSCLWPLQRLHCRPRISASDGLPINHRCTRTLVFIAGAVVWRQRTGCEGYLKTYTKPTIIMLPFNIISELSRTLALAIRLFGNMMSGAMIVGILLTITPFIFPIVMTALGLLTGMVQAYIFSILATVYIAAATQVSKKKSKAKVGR